MFYHLILENETGQQINLSRTANRFMFSKIEGLNPPAGTVSTSSYAGMDGSYLNNAFIEKRNVVIPFEMRGFDVEKRRHELYQVVKPSRYIKIYYSTKNISVYAEGIVETCEMENFEMLTKGQISILPIFTGIPRKPRLRSIPKSVVLSTSSSPIMMSRFQSVNTAHKTS